MVQCYLNYFKQGHVEVKHLIWFSVKFTISDRAMWRWNTLYGPVLSLLFQTEQCGGGTLDMVQC